MNIAIWVVSIHGKMYKFGLIDIIIPIKTCFFVPVLIYIGSKFHR